MIPLVDLKAQYRSIKAEVDAGVARVFESGQFVLGKEVAAFEGEFAAYCGARHAVATNSGTSALHLSLLAAGIGAGDEVITTPFTFVASVAAILYAGARPVLVDIERESFNIDPTLIDRAITPRTKAVLPVHLFGQSADMDAILEVAQRHRLSVIEDAAQAHGAEYKGRRVGPLGELGCFSFYPGKNLGAYGEGGIVVTNNAEHARKIRLLRSWGEERRYEHQIHAFNYRMEALQGAILRVKLRHLDAWNAARRAHAAAYTQLLAGSGVATPKEMPYARHVYHIYAVRSQERDAVHRALAGRDIQTGIHYPTPVHLTPAYSNLGYRAGDFPVAEEASREVLSLPVYPEMTQAQQESVAEAIRDSRGAVKAG